MRRLPDRVATALVLAALVGINLNQHLRPSSWWLGPFAVGAEADLVPASWWLGPLEAAVLVGFARLAGLGWAELGLGRARLRSGGRWALGAVGVVVAVYLVGVLLPATRPAFLDSRYHAPLPEALFTAFVVIPLGTVLLEEIAFRSVLWGMLARHMRPWQVLVTTSVLFGLWHVLPSLDLGGANPGVSATVGAGGSPLVLVAAVAFTTLGGLVFGELRRRSGSVLAPAGAHWATNALGVLFGMVAWRLAG